MLKSSSTAVGTLSRAGRQLLLGCLLAFGLSGCSTSDPINPDDFTTAQTWGAANNVVGVKHLFLSAQPDAASLSEAKANGVGVVINLREPGESEWDEVTAAADAGLTYYNIPVPATGASFDASAMQQISALAKQHSNQNILLHCSSGNRASAWLAIHLADDHGMDSERSIALAKLAGLSSAEVEARVRTYLADDT